VDRMRCLDGAVWVEAETRGRCARCPRGHRRSRHGHSQYQRTLADCAITGHVLTLQVRVRRFRCRVRWCPHRVFTERLPDLARPWARRTERQRQELQRHGIDLGGEAGARHCRAEALPVSARTILRLVQHLPLPDVGTVRVLGVDDGATRRGQRYGTILVNLETHEVLDLLPDRSAETLAAWLVQHPDIEIISRDRAGASAEGARQGAPHAVQVADRFPLDKKVTEALERYLLRQHRSLRQAAQGIDAASPSGPAQAAPSSQEAPPAADPARTTPPTTVPIPPEPVLPEPTTRDARQARDRRAARVARYEEVVALQQQGKSIRASAPATGLARRTVHTFIRAGSFPERQSRAPRRVESTPFLPYLHERWDSGCHNAGHLWRELREQGYRGGRASVTRLLQTWRTTPGRRSRLAAATQPPRPQPVPPARAYSPRTTCWLLLQEETTLTVDEQA
jgi:transposase